MRTEEFRRPGTKDKHDRRRDELTRAALQAIAERGYAATSLRDIAESAGITVGLLHYYFVDREALLTRCLELYRAERSQRVQALGFGEVAITADADALDLLAGMVRVNAHWNRMYYDLRNQSRFEPFLAAAFVELESERRDLLARVCTRWAGAHGRRLVVDADTLYAVMDGLVDHALHAHFGGDGDAADVLDARVREVLERLSEQR